MSTQGKRRILHIDEVRLSDIDDTQIGFEVNTDLTYIKTPNLFGGKTSTKISRFAQMNDSVKYNGVYFRDRAIITFQEYEPVIPNATVTDVRRSYNSLNIGNKAGIGIDSINSINIGRNAGCSSSGTNMINIGNNAGRTVWGNDYINIGRDTGSSIIQDNIISSEPHNVSFFSKYPELLDAIQFDGYGKSYGIVSGGDVNIGYRASRINGGDPGYRLSESSISMGHFSNGWDGSTSRGGLNCITIGVDVQDGPLVAVSATYWPTILEDNGITSAGYASELFPIAYNNILVGYYALGAFAADNIDNLNMNNIALGNAVDPQGQDNICIGNVHMHTKGDRNIVMGNLIYSQGDENILIGKNITASNGSSHNIIMSGEGCNMNTAGCHKNIGMGEFPLDGLPTNSTNNIAFGFFPLSYAGDSSSYNVAIGSFALAESSNTNDGFYGCVAIGYKAGFDINETQTVSGGTYIGKYAGQYSMGSYNLMVGTESGYNTSGSNNVVMGQFTGMNSEYNDTVVIGNGSGDESVITDSVIIGDGIVSDSTVNDSIVIGHTASVASTTISDKFIINDLLDGDIADGKLLVKDVLSVADSIHNNRNEEGDLRYVSGTYNKLYYNDGTQVALLNDTNAGPVVATSSPTDIGVSLVATTVRSHPYFNISLDIDHTSGPDLGVDVDVYADAVLIQNNSTISLVGTSNSKSFNQWVFVEGEYPIGTVFTIKVHTQGGGTVTITNVDFDIYDRWIPIW